MSVMSPFVMIMPLKFLVLHLADSARPAAVRHPHSDSNDADGGGGSVELQDRGKSEQYS